MHSPRARRLALALSALAFLFQAFVFPTGATAQADGGWSIDWIGSPFTSRTAVEGRFGRLQRNELWDKIQVLYEGVFGLREKFPALSGDPKFEKDLRSMLGYAHFYRARHMGHELVFNPPPAAEKQTRLQSILSDLEAAVNFGFQNPDEIEGADELFELRDDPKYKAIVTKLRKENEEKAKADFRKEIDRGFARFARGPRRAWSPTLKTLDGAAFWPAGVPSVLVLSRIHHDGFDKFQPRIAEAQRLVGEAARVGVAFYQRDAADENRLAQTREYVERLGLAAPVVVIGRDEYTTLREILRGRQLGGVRAEAQSEFPKFRAGLANAGLAASDLGTLEGAADAALAHVLAGETTELTALADRLGEKPDRKKPLSETAEAAWTTASRGLARLTREFAGLLSYDIFQPVVIFFDAEGAPVYQTNGVLAANAFAQIIEKYLGVVGAASTGAPEKTREEAPGDAKPSDAKPELEKSADADSVKADADSVKADADSVKADADGKAEADADGSEADAESVKAEADAEAEADEAAAGN